MRGRERERGEEGWRSDDDVERREKERRGEEREEYAEVWRESAMHGDGRRGEERRKDEVDH